MMARGRPKRVARPAQENLPVIAPAPAPAPAPVGTWAHSRILTSKSSAARKPVDSYLSLLLIATTGWDDNYDETERRAIIEALPTKFRHFDVDSTTGHLLCPINASMILDNRALKQAISKLRDEITDGYHEQTWLNQADRARQQRQDGAYDEYLKQHADELFGDGCSINDPAQNDESDKAMTSSDGEWCGEGPIKKPKLRQGQAQVTKATTDVAVEDVATGSP